MSTEPQCVNISGLRTQFITVLVAESEEEFAKTTIIKFREILHEKLSCDADPRNMRLLFAGRQLEQAGTLGDYSIQNDSTIQVVFRVPGGMQRPKTSERASKPPPVEKVHDLSNPSLRFTTTEPDAIFGTSEPDDQPRITMSCGHAVDANSLTGWCRTLIDRNEFKFYCPAIIDGTTKQCKKVWEYPEVRRVAHLTKAEQQYFETKMSEFAALEYCAVNMKECPGCHSLVERKDKNNLRVHCYICTKEKKRTFDFCWHCNKEWSGPTTSSVKCGNPQCQHPDIPAVRDAEMVRLERVGITVPNRRACPTCGNIVEHNTELCKMIICPRCKIEFCFSCLQLKPVCLQTSSYYKKCTRGVAPKQTVIPIWSQNT